MLKLEIKLWLILTLIVTIIPIIYFIYRNFSKIFNFFKNIYTKIEHKKNLETIKNEIIQRKLSAKPEIQENTNIEDENKPNEIITFKLKKIKNEAKVLKERWDFENYEKKLIEWLAINENDIELITLLWNYYFSIWNSKKSLPLLKKILEQDPNEHKTIWQIWQIYFEKWDYETSKLLIKKVLKIKADNPKYCVSMAEIMYNTENLKEAISFMEKALKLRPTNTNYLLSIAGLYEEIWDMQNARLYYFKTLEVDSSNEIAREKINSL